ncbi:kinase-like domain-containing protein [Gorgonomyces haynaldii]|nr:kinase-like domain-containing protein [Gorgonomyces haynaldii]
MKRRRSDSISSFRSVDSLISQDLEHDDKDGHLILQPGDVVQGYRIEKLLGQGTFGKVVACIDEQGNRRAVKIIKAVSKYLHASKGEIRILKRLLEADPDNKMRCVRLLDTFMHHKHACMVFEMLGKSLFDYMQDTQFIPLPIEQVRRFAKQLLSSIQFVHALGFVHTDLKPENLMLHEIEYQQKRGHRDLAQTDIVLIDFGSTIHNDEYHPSVVSTRHYRAPEIILGLPWSFEVDIWSAGCLLIELYTGEALFQTHDDREHLRMIEIILGRFPRSMVSKINDKNGFFIKGHVDFPIAKTDRKAIQFVNSLRPLDQLVNPRSQIQSEFLALLKKMLVHQPNKRSSAKTLLKHRFFKI